MKTIIDGKVVWITECDRGLQVPAETERASKTSSELQAQTPEAILADMKRSEKEIGELFRKEHPHHLADEILKTIGAVVVLGAGMMIAGAAISILAIPAVIGCIALVVYGVVRVCIKWLGIKSLD